MIGVITPFVSGVYTHCSKSLNCCTVVMSNGTHVGQQSSHRGLAQRYTMQPWDQNEKKKWILTFSTLVSLQEFRWHSHLSNLIRHFHCVSLKDIDYWWTHAGLLWLLWLSPFSDEKVYLQGHLVSVLPLTRTFYFNGTLAKMASSLPQSGVLSPHENTWNCFGTEG